MSSSFSALQLARLRSIPKRIQRLIVSPPKRADNPYATHVPVLIGLARILNLQNVVEFGCGRFSTLLFLNPSAFPHLKQLESYENDREWIESVKMRASEDERLKLNFVESEMHEAVDGISFDNCDLIFVDDSTDATERARTIEQIAKRSLSSSVVVIHDYEVMEYQRAAKRFPHRFTFDALNPNTGVAWSDHKVDRESLRRLNRLVKRYSNEVEPDDVERWVKIIESQTFSR